MIYYHLKAKTFNSLIEMHRMVELVFTHADIQY